MWLQKFFFSDSPAPGNFGKSILLVAPFKLPIGMQFCWLDSMTRAPKIFQQSRVIQWLPIHSHWSAVWGDQVYFFRYYESWWFRSGHLLKHFRSACSSVWPCLDVWQLNARRGHTLMTPLLYGREEVKWLNHVESQICFWNSAFSAIFHWGAPTPTFSSMRMRNLRGSMPHFHDLVAESDWGWLAEHISWQWEGPSSRSDESE